MDKNRKDFEAWAIAAGIIYTYTNEAGKEFVSGGEIRSVAWSAWQASRKQALIEVDAQHAADRLELHQLRERWESQRRLIAAALDDLDAIRSLEGNAKETT